MDNYNEPFIFISYAHADSAAVMPVLNTMKANNISHWYDEGIMAGSEWPEFIAEKVVSCSKFILFISKAYLESQNCKRELNFAIAKKKDILSVFIEEVELSPGMELQLGSYQAIHKKRFSSDRAFIESFCKEPFLDSCRKAVASKETAPSAPSHSAENTVVGDNTASTNSGETAQTDYSNLSELFKDNFGNRTATSSPVNQPSITPAANGKPLPQKSKIAAGILAIFLGCFGIHKFYLRKPLLGILYLIFFWTYIPSLLGYIDGIILLCSKDEKFEKKYKCRIK